MILPKTNLSILMVRNAIGYPSTDLGTLCTCDKINIYSRFRPGYWTTSGTDLVFQKPRGNGYNDPRGTDRNGFTTEVYKLGDFRGYNSNVKGAYYPGQNPYEIILSSGSSSISTTLDIAFELGEVDWFGDEPEYWGRNVIPAVSQVVAIDGSGKTVGTCDKEDLISAGNSKTAYFSIKITASGTSTHTIRFALGELGKARYYFTDKLVVNVIKKDKPAYSIFATHEGCDSMYEEVKSQLPSTETGINSVNFEPSFGHINVLEKQIMFETTESYIITYPHGKLYSLGSMRITVYYTVEVYNVETGTITDTWDDKMMWGGLGDSKVRVIIPLKELPSEGEVYRVKMTKFFNVGGVYPYEPPK